jgi:hypothetical protein
MLAEQLPDNFGFLFDGWTAGTVPYVPLFYKLCWNLERTFAN